MIKFRFRHLTLAVELLRTTH